MFERFTDRARRVLVLAQEEARLLDHRFIGTEHILLGLIHEGDGVAARALDRLGIRLEDVRSLVEETVGVSGTPPTGSPPFTPRAKKVLELSLREALQLGHDYIGTEHMLLGLVREGQGVGAQVLVRLGADLAAVRQQVVTLLSGYAPGEGPVGSRPGGSEGPMFGRLARCSFCGSGAAAAGELVAGAGRAFVCERCIAFWAARLRDPSMGTTATWSGPGGEGAAGESAAGERSGPLHPGPLPDGPARAEIDRAFAAVLRADAEGRSVPTVDHGAWLGPVVAQLGVDGYRPDEVTVTVTAVEVKSAHRARVEFTLAAPSLALDRAVVGAAVLVNGAFKVDIETFNAVVDALRRPVTPPDDPE